ncbi:MAG TPA: hypothetical protein VL688_10000 [Verrucomicrobiae bacterium]|jgi:hypothetical protein|nr:hypothetical protein [Verrucomicrobiae bacterium]
MLDTIKQAVNHVSSPATIFTSTIVFFALFVSFPAFFTSPPVALILAALGLAFFGLGLTDEHFRTIVTTPDNVPIVGMLFIFAYFTWYALRKAVVNDKLIEEGKPTVEKTESEEKVMVFPYLIYIEFVVALFYSIGLVLWSIFLKAPLEDPANPTISPNPSKAPWYFLGLQEMLVYFDPWIAGVLFPTFIILGLCAIPYLDPDNKNSGFYCFKQRRMAISTFLFGFWVLWILMIAFGTFLRGPNWNFFGPFEIWDEHKLVPLLNVNLSEFVYIKWLGRGLPHSWFIRELPGIIIAATYLMAPPAILAKTSLRKFHDKLGPVRYSIFMMLALTLLALPLKMYLRWAFNLKYIVSIPEFFFNI